MFASAVQRATRAATCERVLAQLHPTTARLKTASHETMHARDTGASQEFAVSASAQIWRTYASGPHSAVSATGIRVGWSSLVAALYHAVHF